MQKGPRYEVHTKYGWFSLDEGAYQDYLAGKLWITWPPEKGQEKPKTDHVPKNVSDAMRQTTRESLMPSLYTMGTLRPLLPICHEWQN